RASRTRRAFRLQHLLRFGARAAPKSQSLPDQPGTDRSAARPGDGANRTCDRPASIPGLLRAADVAARACGVLGVDRAEFGSAARRAPAAARGAVGHRFAARIGVGGAGLALPAGGRPFFLGAEQVARAALAGSDGAMDAAAARRGGGAHSGGSGTLARIPVHSRRLPRVGPAMARARL